MMRRCAWSSESWTWKSNAGRGKENGERALHGQQLFSCSFLDRLRTQMRPLNHQDGLIQKRPKKDGLVRRPFLRFSRILVTNKPWSTLLNAQTQDPQHLIARLEGNQSKDRTLSLRGRSWCSLTSLYRAPLGEDHLRCCHLFS